MRLLTTTTFSILLGTFFLFFFFFPLNSEGLVVTEFPHFQTFDSWPDCDYPGLCYEKQCPSLRGGWVNPEFHPPVPPYTTDVRHWWIGSGPTSSNLDASQNILPCTDLWTGPCGDHTSGTGRYMFVESSACFGFNFRVVSPVVVYSNTGAKFSFYYYMHGADLSYRNGPGILRADISIDNGTSWQTLTTITGEQQGTGNEPWGFFEAIVDSYFPGGQPASSSNPVSVLFQFYATAAGTRWNFGTYWKGDMAVDDILFTQDGASNVVIPYIDPPPTNNTVTTVSDGGDGLSDGQIVGIVVGVVGGISALCCLLCLLLILLLLVVSPRRSSEAANINNEGL